MQFNLKATLAAATVQSGSNEINFIELKDIITESGADSLSLIPFDGGGTGVVLGNSKTKSWINISFGASVIKHFGHSPNTQEELDECIDNFVVLTGKYKKDGSLRAKPWLSFGSMGSFKTPLATVSLADLLVKLTNSAPKEAASMAG